MCVSCELRRLSTSRDLTANGDAPIHEQVDNPTTNRGGYPRDPADGGITSNSMKAFHRGRRLVKHPLTEAPQTMSQAPIA
jgi:hypothetical protein